jgi:hypothetical protein
VPVGRGGLVLGGPMNSHDFALLVYGSIVACGVVLELISHSGRSRLPSLEQMLTWVMRTRIGRVGVIASWGWLGLHYFAR